jgi:hypothetical protein
MKIFQKNIVILNKIVPKICRKSQKNCFFFLIMVVLVFFPSVRVGFAAVSARRVLVRSDQTRSHRSVVRANYSVGQTQMTHQTIASEAHTTKKK